MTSQHKQVEIQANGFAPTRTTPEEMQQFRGLVEGLFGPQWLNQDEGHRLQRLWARKDELAQLELASLGYAIEALQDHHPKWLAETAALIREQPKVSHGFLCEVLTLGALDIEGAQLQPTPVGAPGYDGEITLTDGHVLRASVKNHDLSSHEAAFRANCLAFANVVRNEALGSGDAWRVILYSVAPMQASSIQGLADKLKAVGMIKGRPYMFAEAEAGLRMDTIHDPSVLPSSYQLIAHSPPHQNEQNNFRDKLRAAIASFAKHSPRADTHTNVVFMRVHATANVDDLKAVAEQLLLEDGCVVDAVYFIPRAGAHEAAVPVIAHFLPVAMTERFREHGVKVRLRQLAGKQVHQATASQIMGRAGMLADLTGRYVFQRGHFYVPVTEQGKATLISPGPGIQTSAILRTPAGLAAGFTYDRSEDDELQLL